MNIFHTRKRHAWIHAATLANYGSESSAFVKCKTRASEASGSPGRSLGSARLRRMRRSNDPN